MGPLTALDIVVLLLVVGGAGLGVLRGFVTEILSLFAWVAAVIVVRMLHTPVTALLGGVVGTQSGAAVLAFVLLFGVTFIAGKLLAASLGRRTRTSILGPVDRVLGFGFGAIKGLLLATLLFLAANLASDTIYGGGSARPAWMSESRTFPLLNASSRAIVDFVAMRRKAGATEPADGNSSGPR